MARVWIFDLDDTLHNASARVFPHIDRSMTRYVMTHLGIEEAEADRLRLHYWHTYGATLRGLVRFHGTNPRHFLHQTHQLPELHNLVLKTAGLRHALRRIRGRKVVFTNSPGEYANRVLDILGVRQHFDRVFSIESTGFRPKPRTDAFLRILQTLRTPADKCVMVEDNLAALKTAKRLGMKTVLVTAQAQRPAYVDASLNSVLALPRIAAYL